MLDPAYSQLLDTNQELRNELKDEIFINKSNVIGWNLPNYRR